VPFTEIRRYMSRVDVIGSARVLINLAGNIVVFIPFGFLLPAMWPKGEKHHPIAAVLVTITFSTVVELLQYLTRSGIADVDDVILNSIGGFVGYLLYRAVEAMHRKKKG
ncbi:MAG: VanZ family protein, partial [Lachnospiraceae bacterium]|nr:VanZ family protein [Lachnospiraceae bacterium]